MSSQYIVKRTKAGTYDLFMRDLLSTDEYRARYSYFTKECDMSHEEAAVELHQLINAYYQKNENPASLTMCEQYIFDTADPGDIVLIERQWWYVMPQARV